MSPSGARPRVGFIYPYWMLWEHTAGPSFRADRMALARAVTDELAVDGAIEPVAVAEIALGEDGAAVRRELADAGVDVVLVLQTMAVPAAWTMAALEGLSGIPVVIWAFHETGLVDGGFDNGSITTQGAAIGAPMISNLVSRAARPFELVLGRRSNPAAVARVAHVDVDDDALRAATGIACRGRSRRVVASFPEVADADVRALEAYVRRDWAFGS